MSNSNLARLRAINDQTDSFESNLDRLKDANNRMGGGPPPDPPVSNDSNLERLKDANDRMGGGPPPDPPVSNGENLSASNQQTGSSGSESNMTQTKSNLDVLKALNRANQNGGSDVSSTSTTSDSNTSNQTNPGFGSLSAGQIKSRIKRDGMITADEITPETLPIVAGVLDEWGKVRESSGSTGGNLNFVETSGFGRVEWLSGSGNGYRAADEYIDRLKDKFVFPIRRDDQQEAYSTEPVETDVRRVQFGANPDDLAADFTQGTGSSGIILAGLFGLAAIAVAVIGGSP